MLDEVLMIGSKWKLKFPFPRCDVYMEIITAGHSSYIFILFMHIDIIVPCITPVLKTDDDSILQRWIAQIVKFVPFLFVVFHKHFQDM